MGKDWVLDEALNALKVRVKILDKLEAAFKQQIQDAKKVPDLQISGLAEAYTRSAKRLKFEIDATCVKAYKAVESTANETTIRAAQKATHTLQAQVTKEHAKGPRSKEAMQYVKALEELVDDLDHVIEVGKKRK